LHRASAQLRAMEQTSAKKTQHRLSRLAELGFPDGGMTGAGLAYLGRAGDLTVYKIAERKRMINKSAPAPALDDAAQAVERARTVVEQLRDDGSR
jgi:hypothetical protein